MAEANLTPSTGHIIQQISNDPYFTDVERYIKPKNLIINWSMEVISLDYEMIYVKDEEDITDKFTKLYTPIIANNGKLITPRNEEGEFIEDAEKVPMFDYLIQMMQLNIPINYLIIGFILENDEDGYFNS